MMKKYTLVFEEGADMNEIKKEVKKKTGYDLHVKKEGCYIIYSSRDPDDHIAIADILEKISGIESVEEPVPHVSHYVSLLK